MARGGRGGGPSLKFAAGGLVVALVTMAAAYLTVGEQSRAEGRRVRKLEFKQEELLRLQRKENYRVANLTSPRSLEELIKLHRLPMIWPPESAVVRIRPLIRAEPLPGEPAAPPQYAAGRGVARHE
jgi:hypothetical protein